MADNAFIIETQDVTKVYGNGAQVRALDGITIKVAQGSFVAIMGPSGSGKSTLLNIFGALDRPTTGQVLINGQNLSKVTDIDRFRAVTVGFIFQLHNLIPTLNALENIEVPMMGQPVSPAARHDRARRLLELVGLGDRMHHLPNQLSGGQRQRIAIARSLANKPALVLADEPTGNLDSQSGKEVIALMRHLNQELGTTFVIVTHDPAVARQTERVFVMQDGKIVNDHRVGHPFEEDLKVFRDSELGREIVAGNEHVLATIDIEPNEMVLLQRILRR